MASVTFSGTFGGLNAYDGLTNTAAGSAIPSGAVLKSVKYTLTIRAAAYSSSEDYVLAEFAVGGSGGSPKASTKTVAMSGTEYTFSGSMNFSASDASKFTSSSITVFARAYSTHSATTYLREFSITVEYDEYSKCGAPTACKLSGTLATSNVTLSWSGAKAGTGNAITGYQVQRAESSDGSTWGSWATLKTVSTTATSGSLSVAPPTTPGNYYKFRVRTQGAAGSSYYSGYKESTNTLRRDHAPLEGFTDTTITAEATPVKALHMQELQDRVNTLRTFYGLTAYGFTQIVAGQTSLAGWSAHVLEIRTAIDGIGKDHDAWLTLEENRPRADIVQQLRDVVLSI